MIALLLLGDWWGQSLLCMIALLLLGDWEAESDMHECLVVAR